LSISKEGEEEEKASDETQSKEQLISSLNPDVEQLYLPHKDTGKS
jgi:hypothetical protein